MKGNPETFALIIGAMKSGTTSLFEILSQHPEVCSSKEKEPDYFTKDRDKRFLDDYLSLWDWKAEFHSIALESSVAYAKAPVIPGVPERIHALGLGDYKFIYMLREPLSRIESQVRHGLFAGWGQSLDIGISEDLLAFSRYAQQIDNYLEYFPRDSILLITLEEFQHNPYVVLDKICDFLCIDRAFHFNDVEAPRNSGEFFNAPQSIARVTQGGIGQFFSKKILPKKMKSWIRNCVMKFSKPEGAKSSIGRWQFSPEERTVVLNSLADDLKKLEVVYGVDVRRYWNLPVDLLD